MSQDDIKTGLKTHEGTLSAAGAGGSMMPRQDLPRRK